MRPKKANFSLELMSKIITSLVLGIVLTLPASVLSQVQRRSQPFQTLAACDPTKDSDGDGTFDCDDQCPDDFFNVTPGSCGCGFVNLDVNKDGVDECIQSCGAFDATVLGGGFCQCPVIQVIEQLIGINFCPTFPVFSRKTIIKDAPGVVVVRDALTLKVTVQVYLQKFSSGVLSSSRLAASAGNSAFVAQAAKQKLKIQYDVVVRSETLNKNVAKRTIKRTSLSLSNLAAGNYSVKYRVVGLKDGIVKLRSKFSPSGTFSVPQ